MVKGVARYMYINTIVLLCDKYTVCITYTYTTRQQIGYSEVRDRTRKRNKYSFIGKSESLNNKQMITSIAHRINRSELRTLSHIYLAYPESMSTCDINGEGTKITPILSFCLYLCWKFMLWRCVSLIFIILYSSSVESLYLKSAWLLFIFQTVFIVSSKISFSVAINTYEFQSQANFQKNVDFGCFRQFFAAAAASVVGIVSVYICVQS